MSFKRTIVFYRILEAIQATNPDGSRKYRYIILSGSSRSSKTTSAIQIYYTEAWNNPGKRLSVWRDTKKDCKDTVGNDMGKIFPNMPYYSPSTVSLHKTESIYTFPSKSTIEICGTDDADKVHGYNGHSIWLNEPYNISKDTFDQLDMRAEDYVIIDMNPKQDHWSDDLKKDPRTIIIHSTFRDNPYCPPEQKAKILSYQPVSMADVVTSKLMSEQEAKQYDIVNNPLKLTDKQINELARCKENENKNAANLFNWMVYGLGLKAERPNRIFRWQEISDDDYNKIEGKRYYAVDWGTVDPWGIIEGKYYDGALYLKELNYLSENELRDSMSVQEREAIDRNEEGMVRWMFNRLQIPKNAIIVCDDNREQKIIALRMAGWDYAIKAIKGPGSIIDGITLLQGLKVYYTKSSANIALEQENYSWEVDRYGKTLEEPIDTLNHLCDPSRYLATFLRAQGIIKHI